MLSFENLPVSRTEKRLLSLVAQASSDFALIEPGDHVMVAVSGGKDSHALLHLLERLRARTPFEFTLTAVNIDQGHPGFPTEVLPTFFSERGIAHRIITEDTYSIVKSKIPEDKTYCSLCSRLRRGILYNVATELGATKIALGHHKDDSIETLLLNLFYSGQIKAMPPKLFSDDGRNIVVRPLIYCSEAEIELFAKEQAFPIVPCDLCGSQEHLQRKRIKNLIKELHEENDNVRGNLFHALSNVRPSHLLDRTLKRVLADARGDEPEAQEEQRERPYNVPLARLHQAKV